MSGHANIEVYCPTSYAPELVVHLKRADSYRVSPGWPKAATDATGNTTTPGLTFTGSPKVVSTDVGGTTKIEVDLYGSMSERSEWTITVAPFTGEVISPTSNN